MTLLFGAILHIDGADITPDMVQNNTYFWCHFSTSLWG